jgi:ubiquinone/menaquinone biosynthesis C-methylase UbiE
MHLTNGVALSAAATAFDRVANFYDELFTHTAIGMAQRKQVWSKLIAAFPTGSRILELNCGTGEDARFLAARGRSVVACDASIEMIEVAKRHNSGGSPLANLTYLQLANEDLSWLPANAVFDGAFSNFSGLNCVSDLGPVARDLANLVQPGGRVLLCIWGRACVAEMLWYLSHGEKTKAFRRFSQQARATLGGVTMCVTYHKSSDIHHTFSPWFRLESRSAVGLFVPPSYAGAWISRHKKLLAQMEWLDLLCADWPVLRDLGDHLLLEFVRCNP